MSPATTGRLVMMFSAKAKGNTSAGTPYVTRTVYLPGPGRKKELQDAKSELEKANVKHIRF